MSRLERGEAKLLGPRLRRLADFYATPAAQLAGEMERWRATTRTPARRIGGGAAAACGPDDLDSPPDRGGHAA
jgi:hypothetical protein